MKIKGRYTEVKSVDVEITDQELERVALNFLNTEYVFDILLRRLEEKLIVLNENTDLVKRDIINPRTKEWLRFYYVDDHKKEDVYKTIRPLTETEQNALNLLLTFKNYMVE